MIKKSEQCALCLGSQHPCSSRLHYRKTEGSTVEADVLNRLRRVAGKQTTRLTHYGRKTGKPYEVTIWFVLDDEKFYIGTANVNRQWVRNVQKTPQVKLSVGSEKLEGTARFLTDRSEHERVMAAIRRKYWMYSPILVLGRILMRLGMMRDNTGSFEVTLER
jgi:deazaflavin-dependent oxidoreductase (nitroreductase family)